MNIEEEGFEVCFLTSLISRFAVRGQNCTVHLVDFPLVLANGFKRTIDSVVKWAHFAILCRSCEAMASTLLPMAGMYACMNA